MEWLSGTGWPALVTAGEAVWGVVQEIIRFFRDLYVELDKRQVFEDLNRIWGLIVDIGGKLWDVLQKIGTALAPVVTKTEELGAKAAVAAPAVDLVADAVKTLLGLFETQLRGLQAFVDLLGRIPDLIRNIPAMPSLNLPFGGPGGVPTGGQLMSYTGGQDVESKLAYAYQKALRKGYTEDQARALLGTLRAEGGMTGIIGDSGQSFGPLQFYMGGQLPNFARWGGWSIEEAKQKAHDMDLALEFALDTYYGAALKRGTAQGLSGPALATYAQRTGQVSINPEKAGALYGPPPGGGGTTGTPMVRIPLGGPGGPGSPLDAGPLPPFMNETFEALPQYLQSLDTIQQLGTETYQQVATVAREQGLVLAGSQTDALGNVMSVYRTAGGELIQTTVDTQGNVLSQYVTLADGTVSTMSNMVDGVTVSQQQMGNTILTTAQDAAGNYVTTVTSMSGQIVSQYATLGGGVLASTAAMNTGVVAQYNQMATTAQQHVTTLGDGTVATITQSAGAMVTTITGMGGEIVHQYATMADGAIVSMTDAAVKTTTVVNDAAGTITKTMTDLSGNVVTTVTDMNGKVLEQTVTSTGQVTQQWATTSADVIKTATAMGLEVIGQSRKMGDGLVTATKDSTGQMVSLITNAAGQVVGQFKNIVEGGRTVATGLDAATKGLKSYADGLKGVGNAAAKAADQLAEFNKQAGGSRSAREFAKRHGGGPVSAFTPYIVGKPGAEELFIPGVSGYIMPSVPEPLVPSRLSAGGGGGGVNLTVNVNVSGSLLSNQRDVEEAVVQGIDSAIRRGRLPAPVWGSGR